MNKSIICILRNIHLIFLGIFFLFVSSATGLAAEPLRSNSFAGQWPYHSSKAIEIDPQRELLFLGDGNAVNILDSDLTLISSFVVTESSQVGGLFFTATDNLLYIACRTEGLKVYDLTDAENPIAVTSYNPDSLETINVFIDDNKAYLSSGIDGIIILDITDINNPSILSRSGLPGGFGISYAIDIHASGNYAFAADLYNGIHIIDVSDPQNPDYKKGIALAGATDIAVSDGYLYIALQSAGMAILDISVPQETSVISLFATEGVATSVRVDGDFAFISYASFGIRALDITNKTEPLHDPEWIYTDSGGTGLGLFADGNVIFFANDQFGLQKIDITDKSNMQLLITFDTPADAVAIDVSGGYIYAVDNTVGNSPEKEGLRIFEISASNRTTLFSFTGYCPTPGDAQDIMTDGEFAYVADGEKGLQIINISVKTAPEIVGSHDTVGSANGIFVNNNYAYVADGNQGVSIIDISDKTAPVFASTAEIDGLAQKMYVSGDYAYVTAGDSGLNIINISDKNNPSITGKFDTPGTANGIFVRDNYAYVADGEKGIAIIDITDKATPILAGTLDSDGFAENISVTANIAYVADGVSGLCSIDVTNPSQPVLIDEWSYNSPGIATDVFSGYLTEEEEIYAFIADGAAGIVAVNLKITDIDEDDEGAGSSGGGGCFIQAMGR